MTKYAQEHYLAFGFPKAPSRKTIRRRFLSLPKYIHWLLPQIMLQCQELDYQQFRCSWGFVDKSVFRALGGIWHKKHSRLGIVPHSSIDTDASWSKSAYHGWRFGYGLHLICLQNRFPVAAWVSTASDKDYSWMDKLIQGLKDTIGIVVGDAGYQSLKVIQNLYENYGILLQTPKVFTTYVKRPFVKWYNAMIQLAVAQCLYRHRRPSIEPLFSLIKQLFDLQGEKQLPYKGIDKVAAFLMIGPLTVQLMMRDNFIHHRDWANTQAFLNAFK
ncbi:MAG: transposase [Roseivirga sp.]|uniref:transposase n=1 Tax=Roseivirga sp. TaxID=1964215 RepID=UPI001B074494|nr:transposase [Roseivirga sp.]MBO6497747.1 transposase [Roseivirga sp.]